MGYRPAAYSPAICWGQHNENIAIKQFFNSKRSQHKNMKTWGGPVEHKSNSPFA